MAFRYLFHMNDVTNPAATPFMMPTIMMIAYRVGIIGINPMEMVTYIEDSPTTAVLSVRDAATLRVRTSPSGILTLNRQKELSTSRPYAIAKIKLNGA